MRVYIHIYNSNLSIDETPSVAIDLEFAPVVGDVIWISDEDCEELERQVKDKFTSEDVWIWEDYIYCNTRSLLDQGLDYKAVSKIVCKDFNFGDAIYVVHRHIVAYDCEQSPRGLHVFISKNPEKDE